jgi:hypothetical protein
MNDRLKTQILTLIVNLYDKLDFCEVYRYLYRVKDLTARLNFYYEI